MNLEEVAKNLRKNNMRTFVLEKREEVVPLLKTLVPEGAKTGAGGSVTLGECGVTDFLRSEAFEHYDRFAPGITQEETEKIFAAEKHTDFYFSSSNAVTEDGVLYNVDGRGNRVSCIAHGPKNVIIVAGKNKIVRDLREAVLRVKTVSAPKNSIRLGYGTYCGIKGKCESFAAGIADEMTEGCRSPGRICCHYLVSGFQRIKDRLTVILINEDLGY